MMKFIVEVFVIIACMTAVAVAYGQDAKDQEPDVPKKPGTCALYFTHQHAAGKSWQLTCADPVPPTISLSLKDSAGYR